MLIREKMICPNCKQEIPNKEFTAEYIIYKCSCGFRCITDYNNKEISNEKKIELEDIYNEGD